MDSLLAQSPERWEACGQASSGTALLAFNTSCFTLSSRAKVTFLCGTLAYWITESTESCCAESDAATDSCTGSCSNILRPCRLGEDVRDAQTDCRCTRLQTSRVLSAGLTVIVAELGILLGMYCNRPVGHSQIAQRPGCRCLAKSPSRRSRTVFIRLGTRAVCSTWWACFSVTTMSQ